MYAECLDICSEEGEFVIILVDDDDEKLIELVIIHLEIV